MGIFWALQRKKVVYVCIHRHRHAYICRSTNVKEKEVMQKHLILLTFDETTTILGSKECMSCFKAV